MTLARALISSYYNLYCLLSQKGSSVYVISRINDDWLYGESGGKCGQFPASFVDHIPSNLPQHRGLFSENGLYNKDK